MVTIEDFGEYQTMWCPGCGNFAIIKAIKQALAGSDISPHEVLFVSGIGQAAKAPHYINANFFNGLHGRSLPVATGIKIANPNLKIICESGDGCVYGEGGNHFLAAIRRNPDITLLVHNNQVYGLTKGQASPTSQEGFVTKFQPNGIQSYPFNPIAVAITMHAGFVARGFSGFIDRLAELIQQAIAYKGLSLVDILHPCVSFNHVNNFMWYKKRCYEIPGEHDPTDWEAAMKLAWEWDERIPLGILYREDRTVFEDRFPVLRNGLLLDREVDRGKLREIMEGYS